MAIHSTKGFPKKTALFDLQVCSSAGKTRHILEYGLQYGIAAMKRKVLIANGTYARNVWIVPHGTEPKTIKRY